jgi:hypothetical protein
MVAPVAEVRSSELRRLAIGCLYLLTNKATLEFPTTTRAHPSFFVLVNRTPRTMFRSGDHVYFPFMVGTHLWHQAVVPVLENKDVQVIVGDNPSLRVRPNYDLITLEQYDTLIRKIETYLRDSMVDTGYLPAEARSTYEQEQNAPVGPTEPDPAGDPIDYDPTGVVDPDVQHPDGTPKLSYNVVD